MPEDQKRSEEPMWSVYEKVAEASWDAPGTRTIWRHEQRDTYIRLMVLRPDFRAMVDHAYRAGREECATCKRVQAIPEHPEMVPNAAEEWQNGFRWGWHYAVKAVREQAAQDQQSGGE